MFFYAYEPMYLIKINKFILQTFGRILFIFYCYMCLMDCKIFIPLIILLLFINE